MTAETSGYNPNTDWMFGNQFNAYYRDAAQVGAWEATKEMNDTAYPVRGAGLRGRSRADQDRNCPDHCRLG